MTKLQILLRDLCFMVANTSLMINESFKTDVEIDQKTIRFIIYGIKNKYEIRENTIKALRRLV